MHTSTLCTECDLKFIVITITCTNYLSMCFFKKIKECDTITGDPHKSGFCPYPAGAICYRKKELNNFVNFTSETVYYHGQNNLGDLGIEGSKPGSATSAVHMANKVIVSFVNFIF